MAGGFRKYLDKDIARAERAKHRAALRAIADAAKRTKVDRRASLIEARATCRANLLRARAEATAQFKKAVERARAHREAEKTAAKEHCRINREHIRSEANAKLKARADERAELARHRDELRRLDRDAKQREKESRKGRTSTETRGESDDAVRSEIEVRAPNLLPVFERVRRSIKPGRNRSRAEAFFEYVEESPGEVQAMLSEMADKEAARMQRQHARAHRAPRSRRAAADERVPF